jgi:hypothetical protein
MRARCWCDAQLQILDDVVRALADEMFEHDSSFDVERWARQCRIGYDRLPQMRYEQGDRTDER